MNTYTSTQRLKIDKALQVHQLQITNPGMTQAQACAEVGIDPKTYRKWIATQGEVLELFDQAKIENERNEYADYLFSKSAISQEFIRDAMKPGMSIPERIKALAYVNERIEELSSRFHTVDIEAEQDLLSGPNQVPGVSKMANRRIVEE